MTENNATISDFYRIAWRSERVWWWFELDPNKVSDRTVSRRLMRGEWSLTEQVHLRNMQGPNPADMPGNTMGVPLVSRRLRDIMREVSGQNIIGSPCELRQQDGTLISTEYFILIDIPVGCGRIDRTRGNPLLYTDLWKTDPWLTDAFGLYFDVSSWSGLGVFFSESSRSEVLAYKTVADAVVKAGLAGVEVTPLVEIGREVRDAMVEEHKRRGLIV